MDYHEKLHTIKAHIDLQNSKYAPFFTNVPSHQSVSLCHLERRKRKLFFFLKRKERSSILVDNSTGASTLGSPKFYGLLPLRATEFKKITVFLFSTALWSARPSTPGATPLAPLYLMIINLPVNFIHCRSNTPLGASIFVMCQATCILMQP